ncbi:putative uridine kinase [Escovopsis weberi]|uniref:Putative uridine kinase n=1 Tax=Escovopsis weberi TaxID=150374 RepID=A0A0M8N9F1_ESCWE|nr:putative uridine kinase [Escovopsis weberi]
MEAQVRRLVEKAWTRYQETPQDKRLRKTTLARIITQELNAHARSIAPAAPEPAVFLPMDGFHYTRAALSAMPDPETAHFRRGAAFTFDAPKFLSLVQSLRAPLDPPGPDHPTASSSPGPAILAPSFDHAVKDPKEDDIAILPRHRIVVAEGLYLALDQPVWRDAAALFDELWFVQVGFNTARRRLGARHVRAGIARTLEDGDRRAMQSDLVNGEEILRCRLAVHELVESLEDEEWVHED